MPTSNFKLFDENKANMLSDSEYNSNAQRLNGVQSGVASSQLQNKFQYQVSLMAYAITQLMVQNGYDATDTTAVTTFISNLSNTMLQKVADKANESQAKAGTDNTKWMTPALVKSAINELAPMVSNILSNETKALYGLDDSATPDDVLAALGKYKQYWWRRRLPAGERYVEHQTNITGDETLIIIRSSSKIQYASAVDISTDGKVTLKNPTDYTTALLPVYTYVSGLAALAPCYVKSSSDDAIYYLPEGATATYTGSTDKTLAITNVGGDNDYEYIYFGKYATPRAQVVTAITAVVPAGDWEYLQSSDRSAYPDSGTSGGYEYEYLGIPFDNAVTAPKIETGSYVGTGTKGSSNLNTLTFDFIPKVVIVEAGKSSNGTAVFFYGASNADGTRQTGSVTWVSYSVSWDGKTMSWYASANNATAADQLNAQGATYNYIAIG